jgi:hypothetical protein
MWNEPEKYKVELPKINEELMKLEGELDDKTAKITFAKFLRHNLGFAVKILCGIDLYPYQEITLKAFFNRNYNMCVWGRGCSKSFIAAVFCFLFCLFNPGAKILIAGPTFRTARNIFTELEKMVARQGAVMLQQCFDAQASKRNDLFEWRVNGGEIRAIPLNGEKIRGFRATVLICDEFLLLSEDIVDTVLKPFLVAVQDQERRQKIRAMEDEAIAEGRMKEEDREVFPDTAKMIALSSASYTFENLYKVYCKWIENINEKRPYDPEEGKFFVSQMAWNAIPKDAIQKSVIKEAQNGGSTHSSFQREYGAQFVDDSAGYFSAKKMKECTVKDGDLPHLELIGDTDAEYILSIDPNASNSPHADFFAMAVLKIDKETKTPVVVHNYANAGGDLKDHVKYFYYLWSNFNFIAIILDSAGGRNFIDAANMSEYFLNEKINFKFVEGWNADLIEQDYIDNCRLARNQYNRMYHRICFEQHFTVDFLRNANEHLQYCIDNKKVWFASRISPVDGLLESFQKLRLDMDLIGHTLKEKEKKMIDVISNQDSYIEMVKTQCSMIEVTQTQRGNQSFDLPQHLRRSESVNRARKDNYTALLLGNWMIKCYYDIMQAAVVPKSTFTPVLI